MRPRTETVTWFDRDERCVIEVTVQRKPPDPRSESDLAALGFSNGFNLANDYPVVEWDVWKLFGTAPYQRHYVAQRDEAVHHIRTAQLLLLFKLYDQMPEAGYRIVSEPE